jgi:hypothetical protein
MKIKWIMMTAVMAAAASAAIITSDDFTGTTLKAQWTAYPGGANSPVTVGGGTLSTTVNSADGNYIASDIESATGYLLPMGNFSIQIDESKGSSSGWWQGCFMGVNIGSNNYQLRQEWRSGSENPVYTIGTYSSGSSNFNSWDMQFKLARVGTDLTFYAKALADPGWTTIGTTTVATDAAKVYLGVYNSSGTSVTSSWDNFVVVVPAPASLALLGLGALGLLRRRR